MFHLARVTLAIRCRLISPLPFITMIIFNTIRKAEHYVKHKMANRKTDPFNDGEQFAYYVIADSKVLRIFGWRCGCGCTRGHTHAVVIGRIKTPA
jgi:hypothetical protein